MSITTFDGLHLLKFAATAQHEKLGSLLNYRCEPCPKGITGCTQTPKFIDRVAELCFLLVYLAPMAELAQQCRTWLAALLLTV
jgi:hypothetical protein